MALNILVLAPMKKEQQLFKKSLRKRKTLKHNYNVVFTGVGKAASASETALFLASAKYEFVALIGFAASTPKFTVGDIVMPSFTRYHDVIIPDGFVYDMTRDYELQGSDGVYIYCGDSFVDSAMSKSITTRYKTPRALFDMESTAVAQVCEEHRVPMLVMKMISDIPECGDDSVSFTEYIETVEDFDSFVSYLETI